MERIAQSVDDILTSLSPVETAWADDISELIAEVLDSVQYDAEKVSATTLEDLYRHTSDSAKSNGISARTRILEAYLTLLRSFLGISKDEFTLRLTEQFGPGQFGVTRLNNDPTGFWAGLAQMGVCEVIASHIAQPVTWRDIIMARLQAGRGSAIAGQRRGRSLEDAVETVIREVFGDDRYDTRCQFSGRVDRPAAKCDFAIPSRDRASIVIEVKAYGATGSKQSDVLGDVQQIIRSKRSDTVFVLVTDGPTWRLRQSDLAKLVRHQNEGDIARIYTQRGLGDMADDLRDLKHELRL